MNKLIPIALFGLILSLQAQLLTLKEAESRAVKNSFEIRVKQSEEQSKEWEEKNAISNYLPSVDYSLLYLKTDPDFVDKNSSPFNPLYDNSFSHEISVKQPITNGGAEIMAIKVAKQLKESFNIQKREVTENAISTVQNRYFDLVQLRAAKLLLAKTIEWQGRNLESAQVKEKAGAIPPTDLLRWETELLTSQNELQLLEINEKSALFALWQAMGEQIGNTIPTVELQSPDELEKLLHQSTIDTTRSIENATSAKLVKQGVLLSGSMKQLKMSAFLPKINAFYSYKWPTTDEFAPQQDGSFWNAGISLSIPIFSGFRNYTAYKQAEYDEMSAKTQMESVNNSLQIGKESISFNYFHTLQSLKLAKQKIDLTTRQLAAVQQRYELGGIGQSVLLEVESAVKAARLEHLDGVIKALKYKTEYQKITGIMEAQ